MADVSTSESRVHLIPAFLDVCLLFLHSLSSQPSESQSHVAFSRAIRFSWQVTPAMEVAGRQCETNTGALPPSQIPAHLPKFLLGFGLATL